MTELMRPVPKSAAMWLNTHTIVVSEAHVVRILHATVSHYSFVETALYEEWLNSSIQQQVSNGRKGDIHLAPVMRVASSLCRWPRCWSAQRALSHSDNWDRCFIEKSKTASHKRMQSGGYRISRPYRVLCFNKLSNFKSVFNVWSVLTGNHRRFLYVDEAPLELQLCWSGKSAAFNKLYNCNKR